VTDLTPLIISGMRRHPSGEVRHIPGDGIGMSGTSTEGFLRELYEWIYGREGQLITRAESFLIAESHAHGALPHVSRAMLERFWDAMKEDKETP
jgi:hypothetical protein